jgi:hypothetical protein
VDAKAQLKNVSVKEFQRNRLVVFTYLRSNRSGGLFNRS